MKLVKKSTLRKISAFLTIYLSLSMTAVPAMAQVAVDRDVLRDVHGGKGGAYINSYTGGFDLAGSNLMDNGGDKADLKFNGNTRLNWKELNVGTGQELNFLNGNSIILNSVDAGANMSKFYGTITAEKGRIIISNPSGIIFDGGKFISSGSLTLTTTPMNLNIATGAYEKDWTKIGANDGAGKIVIQNVSDIFAGGQVELITTNGVDFIAVEGQPSADAGSITVDNSKITVAKADAETMDANPDLKTNPELIMDAAGNLMVVASRISFVKDASGSEIDPTGVAKLTSLGDLTVKDTIVDGSVEATVGASLKGEEVTDSEKVSGSMYYDELADLLGDDFVALADLLDKVDALDTLTMSFSIGQRTLVVNLGTGDWTVRNNGGNVTASGNSGGFTKGQFVTFIKDLMEAEVTKYRSYETHGKLDISNTTISETLTTTAVNTKLDGVDAKDITINTIDDTGGGRVFERTDVVVSFDVTTAMEKFDDFELSLQGTTIVVPSSAFPNNPDVVVSLLDLPDIQTLMAQFKTEILKLSNVSKSIESESSKVKLGDTTPFVRANLNTNNVVAENKITLNTKDVTELVDVKYEGGKNTWALDGVASGNFEAKHLEINSDKGAINVEGVTLKDTAGNGDMTLNAAVETGGAGKDVTVSDVVVGGTLTATGENIDVADSTLGVAKLDALDKTTIDNTGILGLGRSLVKAVNNVIVKGKSSIKNSDILSKYVGIDDSSIVGSSVTATDDVNVNGSTVDTSIVTAGNDIAVDDTDVIDSTLAASQDVTIDSSTVDTSTVTAGNDIAVDDTDVIDSTLAASQDVTIDSSTVDTSTVTAGNDIAVDDTDVIDSGLVASQDVTIDSSTVDTSTVTAGNDIAVDYTDVIDSTLAASQDVAIDSSTVDTSTVTAGNDIAVDDTDVIDSTLAASQDVTIDSSTVDTSTVTAGNDIAVDYTDVIDSTLTASQDVTIDDSTVETSTVTAGNDIAVDDSDVIDSTLTASQDATIENSTVGGDVTVVAENGDLTASNLESTGKDSANLNLIAKKGNLDITNVGQTDVFDGNLYGLGLVTDAENISVTGDVLLGLNNDTDDVIAGSTLNAKNITAGENVGLFADNSVNAEGINADDIYLFAEVVTGNDLTANDTITARSNIRKNSSGEYDYSGLSWAQLVTLNAKNIKLVGFDNVALSGLTNVEEIHLENLKTAAIAAGDLANLTEGQFTIVQDTTRYGDEWLTGDVWGSDSDYPSRIYPDRPFETVLFPRNPGNNTQVLDLNDLYPKLGEWISDGLAQIAPVAFSAEDEDELQLRKRNFLKDGRVRKERSIVHVLDSFRAY